MSVVVYTRTVTEESVPYTDGNEKQEVVRSNHFGIYDSELQANEEIQKFVESRGTNGADLTFHLIDASPVGVSTSVVDL